MQDLRAKMMTADRGRPTAEKNHRPKNKDQKCITAWVHECMKKMMNAEC